MDDLHDIARQMETYGISWKVEVSNCSCGSRRQVVGFLPPNTLKVTCTNAHCTHSQIQEYVNVYTDPHAQLLPAGKIRTGYHDYENHACIHLAIPA